MAHGVLSSLSNARVAFNFMIMHTGKPTAIKIVMNADGVLTARGKVYGDNLTTIEAVSKHTALTPLPHYVARVFRTCVRDDQHDSTMQPHSGCWHDATHPERLCIG